MRFLVIGGTQFVGRHAVEAAVAVGHDVTLFHRGRTNPGLFPDLDQRHGDRSTGDYASLATDEHWDAVIDVCAYVPRHVRELADVLDGRGGHYVHISSISAYDDKALTPFEDSLLCADLADPSVEEVTDETYGPLKAMCERASRERFGEAGTAVVRPTFVAGPHDHTDRFTYWVRRMERGGRVAVMRPEAPLQFVDARDLGAFIAICAATRASGSFDGVGPTGSLRNVLAALAPPDVDYELVDIGAVADAHGIALPMISGESDADDFMARPGTQARANGLVARSIADTASAIRAWDDERGAPVLQVGPTSQDEAAAVAAAS